MVSYPPQITISQVTLKLYRNERTRLEELQQSYMVQQDLLLTVHRGQPDPSRAVTSISPMSVRAKPCIGRTAGVLWFSRGRKDVTCCLYSKEIRQQSGVVLNRAAPPPPPPPPPRPSRHTSLPPPGPSNNTLSVSRSDPPAALCSLLVSRCGSPAWPHGHFELLLNYRRLQTLASYEAYEGVLRIRGKQK